MTNSTLTAVRRSRILTLLCSIFRTALLLPSITKRIEDFLIVHELNANLFGYSIHENLLLSAISTPSAGFEADYERLEFFGLIYLHHPFAFRFTSVAGDSFLKYLASVYVFVTNPTQHEGALHAARQRIISNKVLMQSADRIGLPQYVQSKPFSHKLWYPPNFTVDPLSLSTMADPACSGDETGVTADTLQGSHGLPGQGEDVGMNNVTKKRKKTRDEDTNQWLGDKVSGKTCLEDVLMTTFTQTIADVTEAIIGAAYMSEGQDNALRAAKALQVPIPLVQQWHDFRPKATAIPCTPNRPLRQGTTEAVETIIGHRFRHPHLLAQALVNGFLILWTPFSCTLTQNSQTHASLEGYDATCYERLEFLGDAILDFRTSALFGGGSVQS